MEKQSIHEIKVSEIRPNPYQSRTEFDKEKIGILLNSIRKRGLLQPISVRRGNGEFFLVHGERRWRAHKMGGLKTIRAIIVEREYTDDDMAIDQLIENIMREDLNVVEKATGIQALLSTAPMVKNQPRENRHKACLSLIMNTKLAWDSGRSLPKPCEANFFIQESDVDKCYGYIRMIGMQYNSIIQYLKVLELPEELKKMVVYGRTGKKRRGEPSSSLSLRSAYELTRLDSKELILKLGRRILQEAWSVNRIRAVVDTILAENLDDINYRSKKAKYKDIGLSKLTGEMFDVAGHMCSWRRMCLPRFGYVKLEIDTKAGLLMLRKQAESLIHEINRNLEGDEKADEICKENIMTTDFSVAFGGRDNRLAIPSKVIRSLGLPSFRGHALRRLKNPPVWNIKMRILDDVQVKEGEEFIMTEDRILEEASHICRKHARDLSLRAETVSKAIEIGESYHKHRKLHYGQDPGLLAGALICVAGEMNGQEKTQREIANALDVNSDCMWGRVKAIRAHIENTGES